MIFYLAFLSAVVLIEGVFLAWIWVDYKALQKSTHKVQFLNVSEQQFQNFNDELKQKLSEDPYKNVT